MPEIIESTVQGDYLMYRGKPFVREKNTICYGDMEEEHILFMMILSNKTITLGNKTVEVPDRIIAQIIKSDPTIIGLDRMVKQFEKRGLWEAMNIGLVWLDRLNNEAKKAKK